LDEFQCSHTTLGLVLVPLKKNEDLVTGEMVVKIRGNIPSAPRHYEIYIEQVTDLHEDMLGVQYRAEQATEKFKYLGYRAVSMRDGPDVSATRSSYPTYQELKVKAAAVVEKQKKDQAHLELIAAGFAPAEAADAASVFPSPSAAAAENSSLPEWLRVPSGSGGDSSMLGSAGGRPRRSAAPRGKAPGAIASLAAPRPPSAMMAAAPVAHGGGSQSGRRSSGGAHGAGSSSPMCLGLAESGVPGDAKRRLVEDGASVRSVKSRVGAGGAASASSPQAAGSLDADTGGHKLNFIELQQGIGDMRTVNGAFREQ
jgi:hypothetical protein